eukprot:874231-Prorocentrum_minimum.AAC.5
MAMTQARVKPVRPATSPLADESPAAPTCLLLIENLEGAARSFTQCLMNDQPCDDAADEHRYY